MQRNLLLYRKSQHFELFVSAVAVLITAISSFTVKRHKKIVTLNIMLRMNTVCHITSSASLLFVRVMIRYHEIHSTAHDNDITLY